MTWSINLYPIILSKIVIQGFINSDFLAVKHTFFRVLRVYKSYQLLRETSRIPTDLKDSQDQAELVEIFTRLGMDPTLLHHSLYTQKWIDIGFQGEDPTTDFRGTGKLGLRNLFYFVTQYEKQAKLCLMHSRDSKSMYFLACSGINVSHYLLNRFEEPLVCDNFMNVKSEEEVLEVFNNLYSTCFQNLDKYWVESPLSSDFMNFNTVAVRSKD